MNQMVAKSVQDAFKQAYEDTQNPVGKANLKRQLAQVYEEYGKYKDAEKLYEEIINGDEEND